MAQSKSKKSNTRPVTTTQRVTTGTVIRMEQPKSKRGAKPKKKEVAAVVIQEVNPASGFVGFLREHSVVGVAVGFAIATQVQVVVKQLITSFIDPMYALLFNGQKLSAKSQTVTFSGREQVISWGAFMYVLIDFLFVLLVLYLIIKFFKLDKLEKKDDEDDKRKK